MRSKALGIDTCYVLLLCCDCKFLAADKQSFELSVELAVYIRKPVEPFIEARLGTSAHRSSGALAISAASREERIIRASIGQSVESYPAIRGGSRFDFIPCKVFVAFRDPRQRKHDFA